MAKLRLFAMVAGIRCFGPTFHLFDTTRTLTTTMLAGLKKKRPVLDYDIRFFCWIGTDGGYTTIKFNIESSKEESRKLK